MEALLEVAKLGLGILVAFAGVCAFFFHEIRRLDGRLYDETLARHRECASKEDLIRLGLEISKRIDSKDTSRGVFDEKKGQDASVCKSG